MGTENNKTNEPYRFRLTLEDKFNIKFLIKNMVLANLSICYTWKNIKSAFNSNKFKISAPTSNDEFDLSDGSYSISEFKIISSTLLKNMKL